MPVQRGKDATKFAKHITQGPIAIGIDPFWPANDSIFTFDDTDGILAGWRTRLGRFGGRDASALDVRHGPRCKIKFGSRFSDKGNDYTG